MSTKAGKMHNNAIDSDAQEQSEATFLRAGHCER
jgi:hypothetical protein